MMMSRLVNFLLRTLIWSTDDAPALPTHMEAASPHVAQPMLQRDRRESKWREKIRPKPLYKRPQFDLRTHCRSLVVVPAARRPLNTTEV